MVVVFKRLYLVHGGSLLNKCTTFYNNDVSKVKWGCLIWVFSL